MEDLVLEGMKAKEICARYDMTDSNFSIIRRSPLWVYEEAKMREEKLGNMRKRMNDLVPKALDALERTVDSADERIQVSAAKEILSRGGLPAGVVVEHKTDLGPRELERAQTDVELRMREIEVELGVADEDGEVIDAETVEVTDGGVN